MPPSRYARPWRRATRRTPPMRYARPMTTRIVVMPMPMPQLVDFVNEWGTLPRAVENRPPSDDPTRTALADALHPVFAVPGASDRAGLVTALLEQTGVRPAL